MIFHKRFMKVSSAILDDDEHALGQEESFTQRLKLAKLSKNRRLRRTTKKWQSSFYTDSNGSGSDSIRDLESSQVNVFGKAY